MEQINKLSNRALRELNGLAVKIGQAHDADKESGLRLITQAVANVMKFQELLYRRFPEFEFHYDPDRPPTKFMRDVAEGTKLAETLAARGEADKAISQYESVRSLEPPPLTYDLLTKRIKQLRGSR